MAKFDIDLYNSYLADLDYLGLADYIENCSSNVVDENQKLQLQQNVAELRRFGGIANSILQKEIPYDDRELFKFKIQQSTGVYNDSNEYYKKYDKYKKKIGCKGDGSKIDDIATTITYKFDEDVFYNKFIEDTGIITNSYDEQGNLIKKQMLDGKPCITINKSILQNDDMFNKITKALTSCNKSIGAVAYPVGAPSANISTIFPAFKTYSYNGKGKCISECVGLEDNQLEAYNLSSDANKVYDKYVTKQYEKTVPSDLISLGYMCGAQRELVYKRDTHQISPEEFNNYNKTIIDFYNRQLASMHLAKQPEVYMTEPGGTSADLNKLTSDKEKGEWTNNLRSALKDGRVTYTAGYAGGKVGTIITISEDANNKNFKEGVQLFIPGLFETDARKLIEDDTDAKLITELSDHMVFGHNYNLSIGGRLTNFDGNGGAVYQDDVYEMYKTPEEVKDLMKTNILVEGGIKEAKQLLKRDTNGNLLPNQQGLVDKINIFSRNIFSELTGISLDEELERLEQLKKQGLNNEADVYAQHILKLDKEIDNIFITILNNIGLDRFGNPIR